MKKLVGTFVALFAMMATMLLGSTAAHATTPDDADCAQHSAVVICDVDIDILPIYDPDVVVEVEKVLNNTEIEALENALKNADILNDVTLLIDVNLVKAVVADVLDVDVNDVTVILCAVQWWHPHC